jgi:hypothetical protein
MTPEATANGWKREGMSKKERRLSIFLRLGSKRRRMKKAKRISA